MKTTLKNLISFSMFLMLSAFSFAAFAFDAPIAASYVIHNDDNSTCASAATAYDPVVFSSPAAACASRGFVGAVPTADCGSYKYFKCERPTGGTDSDWKVVQSTRVQKCPVNSTVNGSVCVANSGYSFVLENGSPVLKSNGNECPVDKLYNAATGSCDSANQYTTCPVEKPYLRYNVADGSYYCRQTDSAGDDAAIGLLATISGLSLVVLSGAAASIAACVASILCGSGATIVAIGSVLMGFGFSTGGNPPPVPLKPGQLQVILNPVDNQPVNDALKVTKQGAFIPPLNSLSTADPKIFNYMTGGVTHSINTDTASASSSGSSGGSTTSSVMTSNNNGSVLVRTNSIQNLGGTNTDTNKITITGSDIDEDLLNTDFGQQIEYETGGDYSEDPPFGYDPDFPNGGGDGDGEPSGSTGDCAEYGCATEKTLKQVRDELMNTRYNEAVTLQDDLANLGDNGINQTADRIQSMLSEAVDDSGLNTLFDNVTSSLPIKQIIQSNASNCAYGFNLLGKPYQLSICDYQSPIQSAIAFFLFVAMSFGIVSLIFERPNGGS